ncbi:glucosamine-6-phosphate deaminase [Membranicola marinus]|uniref:Glucosamine-6-phosphate deaminase n=1 Tax=Membranihabitans marinus TaxID=1227546 RepID=A0A953HUI6_9BACT|nr:glucosamine-6-phosphate deaminase [Membranihabitans marinus]MBY5958700.1 glucosamine-6-phosphate deaminase [Membranihabitans marinus]
MEIKITDNPVQLGSEAGAHGAQIIKDNIEQKGVANIIMATGTSQFETLKTLIEDKDIDWSKVVMFHLDEYIGLPITHKASFRKYLKERFLSQVPDLQAYYLIDGEKDPQEECDRLNKLIKQHPIDVAFVGIGENGHLAFNDPPADFETTDPYIVVELDAACRAQQMGEGWFPSIEDVPERAISMSVHQIMTSDVIISSVPDERKAEAVVNALTGEVTPDVPASILQNHKNCTMYLDEDSASLYKKEVN